MPVWIIIAILAVIGGGAAATIVLTPEQDEDTIPVPAEPIVDEGVESPNAINPADEPTPTPTDDDPITNIEEDLDTLVFDDLDAELEDLDTFDIDLGADIDFTLQ